MTEPIIFCLRFEEYILYPNTLNRDNLRGEYRKLSSTYKSPGFDLIVIKLSIFTSSINCHVHFLHLPNYWCEIQLLESFCLKNKSSQRPILFYPKLV